MNVTLFHTPFLQFTEFPNASFLLLLICIDYASVAVLHAIDPFTAVLTAIRISVCSLSMLLIELIVAFVLSAILPHIGPKSMHHAVLERPLEVPPVSPLEGPISTHFIVGPDASILAAIGPKVDSLTLFHSVLEIAVIVASI